MTDPSETDSGWSTRLLEILLDHDVKLFPYVPDEAAWRFIGVADEHPDTNAILLTTEEEGVAFCAGADLVGKRAALVMQSSGVGNCVNFLGLAKGARFPILMIVSMRGEYGETNPWQYPMGQAVQPALDAMGILSFWVREPHDLEVAARAALCAAYSGGQASALILSQKFLGAKSV